MLDMGWTDCVRTVLTSVHLSGTGLSGPHGQDTTSRTDIHNDLVLEDVAVPHNSRVVRSHTVVVGQHLFLVVQLSIRTKVVGKVGGLLLLIASEGRDLALLRGVYVVLVGHAGGGGGGGGAVMGTDCCRLLPVAAIVVLLDQTVLVPAMLFWWQSRLFVWLAGWLRSRCFVVSCVMPSFPSFPPVWVRRCFGAERSLLLRQKMNGARCQSAVMSSRRVMGVRSNMCERWRWS